MTPREIHDLGLSETRRIRAEMEAVIASTGFEGSFQDFLEFLRTDPQFYASDPQDLLEKVAFITKKMDGLMPRYFGTLARNTYEIRPTEGREFYMSVLAHDPDGTGLRDLGTAAELWPSPDDADAWSRWGGDMRSRKTPLGNKILWGMCTSKY